MEVVQEARSGLEDKIVAIRQKGATEQALMQQHGHSHRQCRGNR